jgi:phosphate ABC transporter phosphate-binding protein
MNARMAQSPSARHLFIEITYNMLQSGEGQFPIHLAEEPGVMRTQRTGLQGRSRGWLRSLAVRAGVSGATVVAVLIWFSAMVRLAHAGQMGNGVRTIQVAQLGEGASADALRARVIDRLNASGRFKVVTNGSAADVVLRGTSNIWPTGTISLNPRSNSARQTIYEGYLSVVLENKAEETLWSYLVTPSHFRTASITNDLADHVVAHLLDAVAGGAVGSASASAVSAGGHVALHAAGATLPAPLYLMWFQSAGSRVAYDAVGSEAGIKDLAAGKVDFAASDMPLTPESTPEHLHVAQFATVLGGVVPIYNVPGLGGSLRLTPEVLAGIYLGTIHKWNDPRIVEANRGARLPDKEIAVVHRSDGSGTTFVWTSFLSLVSPQWKTRAGEGPDVRWPVGAGASGSNGVAEQVEKMPDSIGYVELIYAIQHQLDYASVRNPAGEYIKADLESITQAAAGAAGSGESGFRRSILNVSNRDAYPISTYTWLLVPTEGLSTEKRAAIVALLDWMLTSGQKDCASLGYAPLPHGVAASELQAINGLDGRGR